MKGFRRPAGERITPPRREEDEPRWAVSDSHGRLITQRHGAYPLTRTFPRGAWHGMRQPPLPEDHTNTRIQHANYVTERCTPRNHRILTTRTHKPCPY